MGTNPVAAIQWVFSDVDGVLTDACVYVGPDGEALKKFSMRDGMGFELLKQNGIKVGFITRENSPIVAARAKKLKLDAYLFGVEDKLATMQAFAREHHFELHNLAYIGDDVNDLSLLKAAGLSAAPADATAKNREAVHYVCSHNGGQGAFRELADWILKNLSTPSKI